MSDKYCHGIVNCKYYDGYVGDCTFMSMGSGDPDDMPCRVHVKSDYQNTVSKFNIGSLKGYESPIEVMFRDIENRIREQEENAITAEVSRQMGVNVDKDELMKALTYDRDQYNKGYADAKRAYERPKGHWIYSCGMPICSECQEAIDILSGQDNFCPNCGADMREDTDDETEDD